MILQGILDELDHRGFPDAPTAGNTKGKRLSLGLDDHLRRRVRHGAEVEEVAVCLAIGPHGVVILAVSLITSQR